MNRNNRNARFWIYHNGGFCKITLQHPIPAAAGDTLRDTVTITEGGRTDEGYSYTTRTYTHVGDGVTAESATSASDCDGPLDTTSICFAKLDELASYETPDGTLAPDWNTISRSQRDLYAEHAGY